MAISHTAAFRAQADFPVDAKITRTGDNIWSDGVAGDRLYKLVLSKNPGTVQQVLDLASKLDVPFSAKAVMGHLKWLYTAGELEVDGTSFPVQAKAPKPKPEAVKVDPPKVELKPEAKPEPKVEPKAKAPRSRYSGKKKAA
jgi:hypothetical protein